MAVGWTKEAAAILERVRNRETASAIFLAFAENDGDLSAWLRRSPELTHLCS
jgi:hypothetical protein